MTVASTTAPRWAVSTRTHGEVLTAGVSDAGLELVLLGVPSGFTPPEVEGWLRDLAGVALETSRTDSRLRAIPALLHHALTGLLFSQAELWNRASAAPCSAAFVDTAGGCAFGWVGEAVVQVMVDGMLQEPGWVLVRDEEGREARATVFHPSQRIEVIIDFWPAGNDGSSAPAAIEATWSPRNVEAVAPAQGVGAAPSPNAEPEPPAEIAALVSPPLAVEPLEMPAELAAQEQPGLALGVSGLDEVVEGELASPVLVPSESHLSEPLASEGAVPEVEPAVGEWSDDASALAGAALTTGGVEPVSGLAAVSPGSDEASPSPDASEAPRAGHPIGRWLSRFMGWGKRPPLARANESVPDSESTPLSRYDSILSDSLSGSEPLAESSAPEQTTLRLSSEDSSERDLGAEARSEPADAVSHFIAEHESKAVPGAAEAGAAAESPLRSAPAGLAAAGLAEILGAAFAPKAPEPQAEPGPPAFTHEDLVRAMFESPRPPVAVTMPLSDFPVEVAPSQEPIEVDHEPVGAAEDFAIAPAPVLAPVPAPSRVVVAPPVIAASVAPPEPEPIPDRSSPRAPDDSPPVLEAPRVLHLDAPPVLHVNVPSEPHVGPPVLRITVPGERQAGPPVLRVSASVEPEAAPPVLQTGASDETPAAPPVLRPDVRGESAQAPPVLRVDAADPGSGSPAIFLPISPTTIPMEPTAPAEGLPASGEGDAASAEAAPAAPLPAPRAGWPMLAALAERPAQWYRLPWVWGAIVAVVFGTGWLLGVLALPHRGEPGPFRQVLRAVGLGSAHYTADVNSSPPGAWIAVDGVDMAKRTPAKIELKPGEHTLTLTLPEMGSAKFPVRGQKGEQLTLNAPLNGGLEIFPADPSQPISVAVDGTPQGYAPVLLESIAPGLHEVQFTGPGMAPWAQNVHVTVHKTAQLVARPMTAPGTGIIQVQATLNDEAGSTPLAGAQVFVDGAARGVTPLSIELPRGPHSLRVAWRDEDAAVQVIDLPGGNQRFATFEFGLGSPSPTISIIGASRVFPAGQTSMVTAAIDGIAASDLRESWLHVRSAEGLWRRYPMTRVSGSATAAVAAVFPSRTFDSSGRTVWYVSATTAQGDESFSELQVASADARGGASAPKSAPAKGAAGR